MSRSVFALVLAYNEEASLPDLLLEVGRECPDWRVVVVSDGSSDRTNDLARAGGAVLLALPFNGGVASAEQTGFLYALAEGAEIVVRLDGDGQHPATEARRVVSILESSGADVVIGSRFLDGAGYLSTPLRRWGIRWLSLLLRILGDIRVSDPTSGLRAFRRTAFGLMAQVYPSGYPEPESNLLLARAGLRVIETPVRMRSRGAGRSSLEGLASLYYPLKVTFALLVEALRRPVVPDRDASGEV